VASNVTQPAKHPVTYKDSQHGLRTWLIWLAALAVVWILQFVGSVILAPLVWLLASVGIDSTYAMVIVIYSGINIVLAVSLNLVNGFTGQFSMGHAGFMAVGAYASAFLTAWVRSAYPELMATAGVADLVFVLALCVGGVLASAVGYLVGLPSLRLRGDYLAIVTLGFGEIIRVLLLNMDFLGGARGMPNIPSLSSFGWVYAFVVVTTFTVWRLVNSSHGRAFLSVREDEIAAEAMGVNTTRAKVRAFVVGAFFAGIAGGLFAHYLAYLNPQIFDFNRSFEIIIMVVLGGMGSVTGSVVAAIFLTFIREALRPLQAITKVDFRMVIYSLMLIVLMLTRPNGLFGTREYTAFLPKRLRRKILGDEGVRGELVTARQPAQGSRS
jgi:branched-chain amino acid transport system permease protein